MSKRLSKLAKLFLLAAIICPVSLFAAAAPHKAVFTFGGLKINTEAQVMSSDGAPIPGLYAAGELVGGIFWFNYPGGSGLTNGAVFGKIAGKNAATAAA